MADEKKVAPEENVAEKIAVEEAAEEAVVEEPESKADKKKAKKREEQIEIQKEAFVRALETVVGDKKTFGKKFFKNLLTNN